MRITKDYLLKIIAIIEENCFCITLHTHTNAQILITVYKNHANKEETKKLFPICNFLCIK